jgi:hypothetical protein
MLTAASHHQEWVESSRGETQQGTILEKAFISHLERRHRAVH